MVKVRIIPKVKNSPKETVIKGESVKDVILKLHEKHSIPKKIYNKHLKKMISPFRGLIVLLNGKAVGNFADKEYVPLSGVDQSVKEEDEIIIIFPAAGG